MIVAAERGGGSIWRDEVDPLFRSVLGRVVTEEKQSWWGDILIGWCKWTYSFLFFLWNVTL